MTTGKFVEVNLQRITTDNHQECVNLCVDESQSHLVATNTKSLAEARLDFSLIPLAIYDRTALGFLPPDVPVPMVGFIMYELKGGVGFILRIMIDRKHQGKGYGKAAVVEVIRRLKLHPEVQMIAASYLNNNEVSAGLFGSLGFVSWDIAWAGENESEVFVRLDETW
jgi:diamine N-acetyltransferase